MKCASRDSAVRVSRSNSDSPTYDGRRAAAQHLVLGKVRLELDRVGAGRRRGLDAARPPASEVAVVVDAGFRDDEAGLAGPTRGARSDASMSSMSSSWAFDTVGRAPAVVDGSVSACRARRRPARRRSSGWRRAGSRSCDGGSGRAAAVARTAARIALGVVADVHDVVGVQPPLLPPADVHDRRAEDTSTP